MDGLPSTPISQLVRSCVDACFERLLDLQRELALLPCRSDPSVTEEALEASRKTRHARLLSWTNDSISRFSQLYACVCISSSNSARDLDDGGKNVRGIAAALQRVREAHHSLSSAQSNVTESASLLSSLPDVMSLGYKPRFAVDAALHTLSYGRPPPISACSLALASASSSSSAAKDAEEYPASQQYSVEQLIESLPFAREVIQRRMRQEADAAETAEDAPRGQNEHKLYAAGLMNNDSSTGLPGSSSSLSSTSSSSSQSIATLTDAETLSSTSALQQSRSMMLSSQGSLAGSHAFPEQQPFLLRHLIDTAAAVRVRGEAETTRAVSKSATSGHGNMDINMALSNNALVGILKQASPQSALSVRMCEASALLLCRDTLLSPSFQRGAHQLECRFLVNRGILRLSLAGSFEIDIAALFEKNAREDFGNGSNSGDPSETTEGGPEAPSSVLQAASTPPSYSQQQQQHPRERWGVSRVRISSACGDVLGLGNDDGDGERYVLPPYNLTPRDSIETSNAFLASCARQLDREALSRLRDLVQISLREEEDEAHSESLLLSRPLSITSDAGGGNNLALPEGGNDPTLRDHASSKQQEKKGASILLKGLHVINELVVTRAHETLLLQARSLQQSNPIPRTVTLPVPVVSSLLDRYYLEVVSASEEAFSRGAFRLTGTNRALSPLNPATPQMISDAFTKSLEQKRDIFFSVAAGNDMSTPLSAYAAESGAHRLGNFAPLIQPPDSAVADSAELSSSSFSSYISSITSLFNDYKLETLSSYPRSTLLGLWHYGRMRASLPAPSFPSGISVPAERVGLGVGEDDAEALSAKQLELLAHATAGLRGLYVGSAGRQSGRLLPSETYPRSFPLSLPKFLVEEGGESDIANATMDLERASLNFRYSLQRGTIPPEFASSRLISLDRLEGVHTTLPSSTTSSGQGSLSPSSPVASSLSTFVSSLSVPAPIVPRLPSATHIMDPFGSIITLNANASQLLRDGVVCNTLFNDESKLVDSKGADEGNIVSSPTLQALESMLQGELLHAAAAMTIRGGTGGGVGGGGGGNVSSDATQSRRSLGGGGGGGGSNSFSSSTSSGKAPAFSLENFSGTTSIGFSERPSETGPVLSMSRDEALLQQQQQQHVQRRGRKDFPTSLSVNAPPFFQQHEEQQVFLPSWGLANGVNGGAMKSSAYANASNSSTWKKGASEDSSRNTSSPFKSGSNAGYARAIHAPVASLIWNAGSAASRISSLSISLHSTSTARSGGSSHSNGSSGGGSHSNDSAPITHWVPLVSKYPAVEEATQQNIRSASRAAARSGTTSSLFSALGSVASMTNLQLVDRIAGSLTEVIPIRPLALTSASVSAPDSEEYQAFGIPCSPTAPPPPLAHMVVSLSQTQYSAHVTADTIGRLGTGTSVQHQPGHEHAMAILSLFQRAINETFGTFQAVAVAKGAAAVGGGTGSLAASVAGSSGGSISAGNSSNSSSSSNNNSASGRDVISSGANLVASRGFASSSSSSSAAAKPVRPTLSPAHLRQRNLALSCCSMLVSQPLSSYVSAMQAGLISHGDLVLGVSASPLLAHASYAAASLVSFSLAVASLRDGVEAAAGEASMVIAAALASRGDATVASLSSERAQLLVQAFYGGGDDVRSAKTTSEQQSSSSSSATSAAYPSSSSSVFGSTTATADASSASAFPIGPMLKQVLQRLLMAYYPGIPPLFVSNSGGGDAGKMKLPASLSHASNHILAPSVEQVLTAMRPSRYVSPAAAAAHILSPCVAGWGAHWCFGDAPSAAVSVATAGGISSGSNSSSNSGSASSNNASAGSGVSASSASSGVSSTAGSGNPLAHSKLGGGVSGVHGALPILVPAGAGGAAALRDRISGRAASASGTASGGSSLGSEVDLGGGSTLADCPMILVEVGTPLARGMAAASYLSFASTVLRKAVVSAFGVPSNSEEPRVGEANEDDADNAESRKESAQPLQALSWRIFPQVSVGCSRTDRTPALAWRSLPFPAAEPDMKELLSTAGASAACMISSLALGALTARGNLGQPLESSSPTVVSNGRHSALSTLSQGNAPVVNSKREGASLSEQHLLLPLYAATRNNSAQSTVPSSLASNETTRPTPLPAISSYLSVECDPVTGQICMSLTSSSSSSPSSFRSSRRKNSAKGGAAAASSYEHIPIKTLLRECEQVAQLRLRGRLRELYSQIASTDATLSANTSLALFTQGLGGGGGSSISTVTPSSSAASSSISSSQPSSSSSASSAGSSSSSTASQGGASSGMRKAVGAAAVLPIHVPARLHGGCLNAFEPTSLLRPASHIFEVVRIDVGAGSGDGALPSFSNASSNSSSASGSFTSSPLPIERFLALVRAQGWQALFALVDCIKWRSSSSTSSPLEVDDGEACISLLEDDDATENIVRVANFQLGLRHSLLSKLRSLLQVLAYLRSGNAVVNAALAKLLAPITLPSSTTPASSTRGGAITAATILSLLPAYSSGSMSTAFGSASLPQSNAHTMMSAANHVVKRTHAGVESVLEVSYTQTPLSGGKGQAASTAPPTPATSPRVCGCPSERALHYAAARAGTTPESLGMPRARASGGAGGIAGPLAAGRDALSTAAHSLALSHEADLLAVAASAGSDPISSVCATLSAALAARSSELHVCAALLEVALFLPSPAECCTGMVKAMTSTATTDGVASALSALTVIVKCMSTLVETTAAVDLTGGPDIARVALSHIESLSVGSFFTGSSTAAAGGGEVKQRRGQLPGTPALPAALTERVSSTTLAAVTAKACVAAAVILAEEGARTTALLNRALLVNDRVSTFIVQASRLSLPSRQLSFTPWFKRQQFIISASSESFALSLLTATTAAQSPAEDSRKKILRVENVASDDLSATGRSYSTSASNYAPVLSPSAALLYFPALPPPSYSSVPASLVPTQPFSLALVSDTVDSLSPARSHAITVKSAPLLTTVYAHETEYHLFLLAKSAQTASLCIYSPSVATASSLSRIVGSRGAASSGDVDMQNSSNSSSSSSSSSSSIDTTTTAQTYAHALFSGQELTPLFSLTLQHLKSRAPTAPSSGASIGKSSAKASSGKSSQISSSSTASPHQNMLPLVLVEGATSETANGAATLASPPTLLTSPAHVRWAPASLARSMYASLFSGSSSQSSTASSTAAFPAHYVDDISVPSSSSSSSSSSVSASIHAGSSAACYLFEVPLWFSDSLQSLSTLQHRAMSAMLQDSVGKAASRATSKQPPSLPPTEVNEVTLDATLKHLAELQSILALHTLSSSVTLILVPAMPATLTYLASLQPPSLPGTRTSSSSSAAALPASPPLLQPLSIVGHVYQAESFLMPSSVPLLPQKTSSVDAMGAEASFQRESSSQKVTPAQFSSPMLLLATGSTALALQRIADAPVSSSAVATAPPPLKPLLQLVFPVYDYSRPIQSLKTSALLTSILLDSGAELHTPITLSTSSAPSTAMGESLAAPAPKTGAKRKRRGEGEEEGGIEDPVEGTSTEGSASVLSFLSVEDKQREAMLHLSVATYRCLHEGLAAAPLE